jgi:hypothetical protein
MQIHLFECKSTVPLRRGLASNKLNLCMLVLSQLRDTYWSASVIYRLFERAQKMLDKSQSQKTPINSHLSGESHSNRGEFRPSNQQHYSAQNQEDRDDTDNSVRKFSEVHHSEVSQVAPFWLNESPYFSNVDQLLSPGFIVDENIFQSFFTEYENGAVGYDQMALTSNDAPGGLSYSI